MDFRPLAVVGIVLSILGYYTSQINAAVKTTSLVMASSAPVVLGSDSEGYTLTLDRKWKRPSKAGEAWLKDMLGPKYGPESHLICNPSDCGKLAVLKFTKSKSLSHRPVGMDEFQPSQIEQILSAMGCRSDGETEVQKRFDGSALGYYFRCQPHNQQSMTHVHLGMIMWDDHQLSIIPIPVGTRELPDAEQLVQGVLQNFHLTAQ